MRDMWKALVLAILSVLILLPAATIVCEGQRLKASALPMILHGRVYCDTCRAGFETDATIYMPGAKVRVECRNKELQEIIFTKQGITDSSGKYKIVIKEDHVDEICDVMLISSSQQECSYPGRDRSRVSLTIYNGMASNDRFANSLGFLRDQALSGCDKFLEKYSAHDDDD